MIRLISLFFILTNSVLAQAAVSPVDLGIAHVDFSQWKATHAGPIELDGLQVLVALEKVENKVEIPSILADKMQTLVPIVPMAKKEYRLVFVAVENPSLRAKFPLEPQTVNVDGVSHFALVSAENSQNDFRFFLVAEGDGTYHVSFTRNVGGSLEQGEFQLAPMAQTLQK